MTSQQLKEHQVALERLYATAPHYAIFGMLTVLMQHEIDKQERVDPVFKA